ncbi:putative CRISPR-associated protein [SCandidatus Aminicenantes bacterium Aminicenantia_JdfR_composite]|jgi:putative CRISPR-associated protein (TIGR02619 family)|nr:putative CRISPR-associated protein [SCandidatus Aminicenantes bacterium Aminicenantia_JdfR_composite]MCP2596984.1 putative CRISPR-associated protein [Candidatus Aminicenantes bacterium AC-335-G13]MCP2598688.1 putative CRISPR-associated protein [Candidatus Aminicenantes bacterium AC-335-L06]MCP2620624.1 putative CRISPR-associated protein [Candidatus Aminicenantes bacterium AC-334-E05]
MKPYILICTVGTSLFTNIERLRRNDPIKVAKNKGNYIGLTKLLLSKNPEEKLLGAEINSITSLLKKGYMDRNEELYLLVSDTDEGREVGNILKSYYESTSNFYKFQRVLIKIIEGLKDEDIKTFKNKGLKNLVKEIASIVRSRGSNNIIINATGGYKAQISFAGLIGQALEIPVMYMFERFDEIIELPPQPLSFDFELWLKYYEEFCILSEKDIVEKSIVKNIIVEPTLNPLIEVEKINDKEYVCLNAMGQLFHEGFIYRFKKERKFLLPIDLKPRERKEPKLSQYFKANSPIGAEEFVRKVWNDKKYILTIRDFYVNPDLPEKKRFIIDKTKNKIVLVWSDGKRTAKFIVEIKSKDERVLKACLVDLNHTYFE